MWSFSQHNPDIYHQKLTQFNRAVSQTVFNKECYFP